MKFSEQQQRVIEDTIKTCLRKKLHTYSPESVHMPFHYRLLGKDRMALFSFIHSLNTTFGTSIFEPVAEVLAKLKFPIAERQYVVGNQISEGSQVEIQHIMNELSLFGKPDKEKEMSRIRRVCQIGEMNRIRTVRADLYLQTSDGEVFLVDIKTAKPNISDFKGYKRTLLEWSAIYLAAHPQVIVNTVLAIPYNPYEPKPYERWTLRGMLDLEKELFVGQEFWDFLGGEGAYQWVLDAFERAGVEMRPELDAYFKKYN